MKQDSAQITHIPIVYITDDNYVMPTIVSITSLLKNAGKDTNYQIYVIGVDLSSEEENSLKNLDNIKLLQYDNKFKDFEIIKTYVSKAAFYKFEISEIFKEYDKILYLDSDTIILDDLTELFNTNIENYYAAVVKDCVGELTLNDTKRLNIEHYFNSGVMLLNLKKMREDDIENKLIKAKKTSPKDYLDQEIFNVVFKNCVKYLHPNYNYMVTNSRLMQKTIKNFYNTNSISPLIVHLTYLKPWEYKDVKYSNVWQRYYKISPYKDKKLSLKRNPDGARIYKKQKFNDRWIIDFLGLRFSYKKGGKDFRLFYP